MAADISNVVQVTISRETRAVSRTGFGIPLIMGPNGNFLTRTRQYENLDGVAEDYLTTEDEYRAAQAIFSQSPRPRYIMIGRREPVVAQVEVLTFDADFVAGNTVDYEIDGVAQATVNFNADHATTLADLAAAIQTHPVIATATVTAAREITITAQTPGVPFSIAEVLVSGGISQPLATVANSTPNYGIEDDLIAARQENDDWYALIITSRDPAEVQLMAAYIETQRKIFITCSNDTDILDPASTTDIGSVLNAANYTRTAVFYNGLPIDFADAAWLGRCLPEEPGAITWKFKNLAGITSDNLTATERSAALAKNVNLYTEIGGQDITEEGTVASGEFVDIVRDIDWLQAQIEEEVFAQLVNVGRVPFTDPGIATIENIIRAVQRRAVSNGVLAASPEPQVFVPRVADVPQADRANRFLPDVSFSGTLANAIHRVDIDGVVSV